MIVLHAALGSSSVIVSRPVYCKQITVDNNLFVIELCFAVDRSNRFYLTYNEICVRLKCVFIICDSWERTFQECRWEWWPDHHHHKHTESLSALTQMHCFTVHQKLIKTRILMQCSRGIIILVIFSSRYIWLLRIIKITRTLFFNG